MFLDPPMALLVRYLHLAYEVCRCLKSIPTRMQLKDDVSHAMPGQGLLEFIWTEGCLGRSSKPGTALAILVLLYKENLASLTLQQVQILGLFLCMVCLTDLLTYPY